MVEGIMRGPVKPEHFRFDSVPGALKWAAPLDLHDPKPYFTTLSMVAGCSFRKPARGVPTAPRLSETGWGRKRIESFAGKQYVSDCRKTPAQPPKHEGGLNYRQLGPGRNMG